MNFRLLASASLALFAFPCAVAIVHADAQRNVEHYYRNGKKPLTEARHLFKTPINPKDGAVMIFIPAGPFLMGDRSEENNPRRRVTLPGYWIYKNVVTIGMYMRYCRETGKQMPDVPNFYPNWGKGEEIKYDHPIVDVYWSDAVAYCKWAGVSLPTEAQWEKAARGTDGRRFPWGSTFDRNKLWASNTDTADYSGTHPVGERGISPYGCTDMAGNVSQWCADRYNVPGWLVAGAPLTRNLRVLRGSSWLMKYDFEFPASYRDYWSADIYEEYIGFRCVAVW
jgi:serine/threonine-protein kinase